MTTRGIDYGRGQTNVNPKTGIRYGIIPMNSVIPELWEDLEPEYGNPHCPHCGEDLGEDIPDMVTCPQCGNESNDYDCYPESPDCWSYDGEDWKGFVDSYGDLWIVESKTITRGQFCSPCAPGAIYLQSGYVDDGELAYCLPLDCFSEDFPCPYAGHIENRKDN